MQRIVSATTALAVVFSPMHVAAAQEADEQSTDTIIVTGTRAADRTVFDSLAPIDVVTGEDLNSVSSDELMDALAVQVPSFNVQRLPLADGLIFVRPATLRSLSPDQTLVLINGKRRHRSALLGNRGAQAPDLANISTFAIGRTEVLRDGASAQYGSDAIAGVINIILDETVGYSAYGQAQQYYAGDGEQYEVGGKAGFDLGGQGFVGLTVEYADAERTSRTRQRADAILFEELNPGVTVADPVQNWGQPERDALRLAANARFEVTDALEAYAFATFADSEGVSDFNYRNPVITSAFGPIDANGDFVVDGDGSGVSAIDPDYNLLAIYPNGFTPQFGQEQTDFAAVGGARGELFNDLGWDVSISYGDNEIDYFIFDTINGSLGSASPTSFDPGVLGQEELNLNADFTYLWDAGLFAEPVNVAFGAERREETYIIEAGDAASFTVGPLAAEGFPSGSNGFPGYTQAQAGEFDQTSYAGYIDVEAPVTDRLTIGGAVRFEDFSEFGSTTDFKVSGRFEVTPDLAARATVSTGFRAPTPGQLFSERTSQGLNTATLNLFTNGRFSPTGPVADIINERDGGPFIVALEPEESENYSFGVTYRNDLGFTGTVDVYQINIDDRISTFSSSLSAEESAALDTLNLPGVQGVNFVSFFQNLFDTETRGVDVVGSYGFGLGAGDLSLTGAYNYNETEVQGGDTVFSDTARRTFEEGLPQHNATFQAEYDFGPFAVMGRARYYGEWTDTSDDPNEDFQTFGAEVFVDLAATYDVTDNVYVRVGAENIFDTFPDESRRQAVRGLIYSRNAPYDTDGGLYYVRVGVDF